MAERDPLLDLAATVVREADALGIPSAIIGALALAHHGYVRATVDVDLAVSTSFTPHLRELAVRLRALGLVVEERAPDVGDPIDGVLRVRAAADGDPVDVINFDGPRSPGGLAVRAATASADGFHYARVPELVALKLYAGSRFDRDDAARLLTEASDVDLAEVRRTCDALGLGEALERLLAHLED